MVLANAHTWSGSAALNATCRRNICSFQGWFLPLYCSCISSPNCWNGNMPNSSSCRRLAMPRRMCSASPSRIAASSLYNSVRWTPVPALNWPWRIMSWSSAQFSLVTKPPRSLMAPVIARSAPTFRLRQGVRRIDIPAGDALVHPERHVFQVRVHVRRVGEVGSRMIPGQGDAAVILPAEPADARVVDYRPHVHRARPGSRDGASPGTRAPPSP